MLPSLKVFFPHLHFVQVPEILPNPERTTCCHLPVRKKTYSARAPDGLTLPPHLLRGPQTFPAGLCPNVPFSSELKHVFPSLWVLVFCCFFYSRHRTYHMWVCLLVSPLKSKLLSLPPIAGPGLWEEHSKHLLCFKSSWGSMGGSRQTSWEVIMVT